MVLLGGVGFVLIHGGQYLYKEKLIKKGFQEGLYNTSVSYCPENKEAKRLLIAGQICIITDIVIGFLFYFYF